MRYLCLAVWFCGIVAGIGSFLYIHRHLRRQILPNFCKAFGARYGLCIWLCRLCEDSLLPSTPLVIAGTLLFPYQSFSVLSVSIVGILLSSSMIYFFSEYLGFAKYFEGHKPELTHKLKAKLEHPLGFIFVALWAFFPLVPTDLVCYLAGTTRMTYGQFISAVFVGEMLLCSFYVFVGGAVISHI